MKIYLLRHEKRSMLNPTFYSPLLVEGLEDANKLKYLLDKENINLIFSSPFKRVLQTIKPFCDMKKTNVNIEYSLYERITCHSHHKIKFDKNNFHLKLLESDEEYYLMNQEYESFLNLEDVKYGDDSKSRALNFLNFVKEKYKSQDVNILFATHAGLIDDITKDGQPHMGSLTLHCENDKILNLPINYIKLNTTT